MNKISGKLFAIVLMTVMILAVLPQISVRPTHGAPPLPPPPPPPPLPCLCLLGPSGTSSQTFSTATMGVGSTFTITAWVNTTYDEAGWSGALFFNSTQLNAVSVAFTANDSSQSAWFYDQGIYTPYTGTPPFMDMVTPSPPPDNVTGSIAEPSGFGEMALGTAVLAPGADTLFTVTFEVMMVPPAGQYLTSEVSWDPLISEIYTPLGVSDLNVSYGNFLYNLFSPTPVLVTCNPNSVPAGSPVTCTASVGGSNPTGTVTWTTSSSTGIFSPAVCTISSGKCSTTYTDSNTGLETITATYGGDSNNFPGSGSTALAVSVNEAPCLYLLGPSGTNSQTFYTNTTSVGSTFTVTAWVNTTYSEGGWSGALFFNSTQLNAVSVAFTANDSSQSAWFYDSGSYTPDTGTPPFTDMVMPPSAPDNVGGTIGEPSGFGENALGNTTLATGTYTLFTVTFEVMMVPPAGQYLTSEVSWDPLISEIYTPLGVSDLNVSLGSFVYSLQSVPTPVLVTCSPNSVSAGSPVTCTASVVGFSPTGTVSWTTSSSTGYFSPAVCTLSSGTCSTTYTDSNTAFETITATYGGDSNNLPGNGSTTLTVYVNVTTGTNVTVTPTENLQLTFANVTTAGIVVANATPTVEAPNLDLVGSYYVIDVTAGFSGNVTVGLAFDGSNMTVQQKENLTMNLYTPILGNIQPPWGIVTMRDVAYEARHFGTYGPNYLYPGSPPSANWDPACDLNGDNVVNMRDVALMDRHFGFTATWVDITTYVDTTNNIIYGNTTHFSFIGIH